MQTDIAVRLICPFRCQFNLDNTFMSVDDAKFASFLHCIEEGLKKKDSSLRAKIPDGLKISVQEHDLQGAGPRYVSVNEAGNMFHSPAYLDMRFGAERKKDFIELFNSAAAYADKYTESHFSKLVEPNFNSLLISIFDHTIGILTLDIELNEAEVKEHPEEWKGLDGWTTFFMEYLIDDLYPRFVHPTLDDISSYVTPFFEQVIVPPSEHVIYQDMVGDEFHPSADGKLLWVNRTLLCPPGTELKGWQNIELDDKDAVNIDEAKAYLYACNSVVEMPKGLGGHNLRRLWEGLYIGQYYYAAMDVTSKNISRYVGLSYITKSNSAIRELSSDMEFVINAITIFQVRYRDLYLELQGIPLQVFQRIENEWEFEKIFSVVQNKITICRANVGRLNQLINQRNQLRVQVVLAIVAGMSLVNLMIQISRFVQLLGKEAVTSPEEVIGILNLAVLLTPNMMGWLGCFLAILVVMTILYNRPR